MSLSKYRKSVGRCPICNKFPTWFNNIPLTAYCFGKDEDHEHIQVSRVLPDPFQPYGSVGKKTVWKKANGHKV